jgi:CD2 antigen cytoplasmic tail-binding protein 2
MPPRQAHKRAGSSEGTSQHATKKTRFVEPEEDPANFAEEVDAQLENPSAKRKGRVRTEGYESDSSDEGESVVLSRRRDAEGAAEDDDDDMFAAEDKAEKRAEEDGKKKEEKFLRLGDIEGQEFGKATGEDEDSESESEPEDEDDAERRKKASMGFEMSSFNMREEMEEGKFAEDGTYIRTFDPHAVHDKWMDDMDEKEIKKARRQHRHMERIQKEKQKAEEREMQQLGGKDEMEKALLPLLKKGETVLEALQRLGAKAKKNSTQNKRCIAFQCVI